MCSAQISLGSCVQGPRPGRSRACAITAWLIAHVLLQHRVQGAHLLPGAAIVPCTAHMAIDHTSCSSKPCQEAPHPTPSHPTFPCKEPAGSYSRPALLLNNRQLAGHRCTCAPSRPDKMPRQQHAQALGSTTAACCCLPSRPREPLTQRTTTGSPFCPLWLPMALAARFPALVQCLPCSTIVMLS
jgi:hypothetical protein